MSPSRDVQALFDRFGGDAASYREIGMENEAHEARGRWPLLGMIDPRQVELPAADADRDATPARDDTPAREPVAREDSQAVMRRSAPLFTRSPRRDVPPVLVRETPAAPESAEFRFLPVPGAGDEAAQADDRGALLASARAPAPVQTVRFNPAVSVGFAQPSAAMFDTPEMPRPMPLSSRIAQPGATPANAPLKRLFGDMRAGAGGQPSALPARAPQDPERLDDLFARLRGGALKPTQAEARSETRSEARSEAQAQDHAGSSPRPWFLREAGKGVSGP